MDTVEAKMSPKIGDKIVVTDTNRLQMVVALLRSVGVEYREERDSEGAVTFSLREME